MFEIDTLWNNKVFITYAMGYNLLISCMKILNEGYEKWGYLYGWIWFLYMQFRINAESVSNYTELKNVCAYSYKDYKSEKKIANGGSALLWNWLCESVTKASSGIIKADISPDKYLWAKYFRKSCS